MSRTINDLTEALFAQLDRITDPGLTGENLLKELDRTKVITELADPVLRAGELTLNAVMKSATVLKRGGALPGVLSHIKRDE